MAYYIKSPSGVQNDGADVRTGSELFRQDYPEVIRSYDITHKIGWLLKKYLAKDERWQELQADLRSIYEPQ